MNCTDCGAPLGPDDDFCGSCGSKAAAPAPEAPPVAPARRTSTGLIVGCAVLAMLLLCGCLAAGAGICWYTSLGPASAPAPVEPPPTQPSPPADDPGAVEPAPTAPGTPKNSYPTPVDALKAELPAGWVWRLASDKPQQQEYWAGPPNSEWDTVYLVEPTTGGGWVVRETYPLEIVDEFP